MNPISNIQYPKFPGLFPATTHSPEETRELGAKIAGELRPGDVLALYGELGAGKTHLVQGIARALGVPDGAVTSPTFTIVNEYTGPYFDIYHFDAYRIKSQDEFYELGFEDYFYGDGLCIVEWPDKVESLLPENTIRLKLSHLNMDDRKIEQVK
ncbi:MAG TPA: tRNA (adenosine(37)-N6)-threonylcarbamoyltransferase complex ATPase subunit type 1 TsaE [Rhodothermales bacterium]|nr:tRNA (adenosine(37)-N6)-threonylcarbamoyltransferase complex ATPase subunit type 1 TsaE [Rhodothermales bacterium]